MFVFVCVCVCVCVCPCRLRKKYGGWGGRRAGAIVRNFLSCGPGKFLTSLLSLSGNQDAETDRALEAVRGSLGTSGFQLTIVTHVLCDCE